MDASKLNSLNVTQLMALRTYVDNLLEERRDKRILPGMTGKFIAKDGSEVTARVLKNNRTTIGVEEISPMAGRKWKVGRSIFRPDYIEKRSFVPVVRPPKHAPETETQDHW